MTILEWLDQEETLWRTREAPSSKEENMVEVKSEEPLTADLHTNNIQIGKVLVSCLEEAIEEAEVGLGVKVDLLLTMTE